MGPSNFKMFGSIAKVEEQADGTIKVYGIASSPARDAVGESITAEAMKGSLPDYQKFPALREMHQPSAAGRVTEIDVDGEGATNIVAHVVDPIAVMKVKTGVYSGFSIGGKVLKRNPTDRSIIDSLKLVEISLVDSPCNPDAVLSMWKVDLMPKFKPENAVVIARAKTLAKAAGTQRFRDFLFEANEELAAEHMLKAQEGDEQPDEATETGAEATEEAAAAAEAEETAEGAEGAAEADDEAAAGEEGEEDKTAAAAIDPDDADHGQDGPLEDAISKVDPAAVIAAAIEGGRVAMEAAAAPTATTQIGTIVPFEDLGKAGAALKTMKLEGETVAKSLYHVSRMAELLCSFASLQSCVASEAAREGDGSAMAAMMADQIKAMGECLVMCAKEEVAEMVADLDDGDDDGPTVVFYDDYVEYGAAIVDLVKADTALMEAAAARLAKPAAEVATDVEIDPAEKAALTAEVERLSKALETAAPAVEELTKSFSETVDGLKANIADLEKRFSELDHQVLPPKTAGPAITATVSKGQDSTGNAGPLDISMSDEQLEKAFAELPEKERGEILLKAALRRPQAVAQRT